MLVFLNTFEPSSKSEMSHYIIRKIICPVAHVLLILPISEILTPNIDVLQDQHLCRSYCCIGESMSQYPSSKCMLASVDLAVGAEGAGAGVDGSIPLCLSDVGF